MGLAEDDPVRFQVSEEEELVPDDGQSQGGAELILAVLRDRRGSLEELANVVRIVAVVLP